MIHVLNYSENIIDDLSFKQDAIYDANHVINIQETMETFDFEVSSKIAQNLRDRHRLIIQDHMGIYREFIIENIIDLESGVTEIQANASYLDDIKTAKPVKPHSFKNQPPTVMMEYLLADTGWEVSPETEVSSHQSFEWDKVTDRLELLKELQDVFNMRLLFYVVVGKNNIEKRYVKLVEVNPMFNGEEIDYKENLIGLKREIDYSEVVTALLGVGPEDSETKKRLYVEVTDDKAQEQFGLPKRYIWDYYEVQVDSETKVTSELIRKETLKELEKRKQAVVTYDISSTDIDAQVGDMIRVKDEDFNPEIYLEAEIVEIHYNLLNNVKEYKFGVLREFTREQVYSQYEKFRKELEERLKEIVSNTDSIISDRLEEELKYVERYIEKSPTPPLSPKEGDLWLDTSDPKVAILKRYENGKWVKSSVDSVKDIGGMTREETLYEALKERLTRNEISYSEAFKRHVALVSEKHYHYVNNNIKSELAGKYNELQQKYDAFIQSFESINSEQPTIGLITTAISKAIEFEAKLKEYNDSYYNARKAFDEVIALLQSQYSDEKYNELINEVADSIGGIVKEDGSIDMSEEIKRRNDEALKMIADAIGGTIDENGNINTTEVEKQRLEEAMKIVANAIGGTWNGSQLIADIPNRQDLIDLNTSIKQYLNGELDTLDGKLGKQIETVVNQAKDEFSVKIDSVEKKVDGIEIGGRNLAFNTSSSIEETSSAVRLRYDLNNEAISRNVGKNITISFDAKFDIEKDFSAYIIQLPKTYVVKSTLIKGGTTEWKKFSFTDVISEEALNTTNAQFTLATSGYAGIRNLKVEFGNKPTDWTPAPEDIESDINNLTQEVTKNTTSLNVLENEISLKADSNTVKQILNDELEPIKSNVQTNQAELNIQAGLIASKVDSSTYETDKEGIVKDIETNSSAIEQTSKSLTSNINSINKRIGDNEKVINTHKTSIAQLNNEIALKVNSQYVKDKLDEELKVVKTDIGLNKAELILLDNKINSKVESSKYTKDKEGIISDISTTKSQVEQLSNSFTVEIDSVNKKVDSIQVGGRNWFAKSKVVLSNNLSYDEQLDLYYNVGYNRSFSIFRMDSLGLELNQKYILAYEIKSNIPELELRTNTYINGSISINNNSPELIEGEWVKVYTEPFLYRAETTAPVHIYFNQDLKKSRDIEIRNVQINRGTILQDYQEAPEDTEARMAETNKELKEVKESLAGFETTITTTFKDGIIEEAEAKAINSHKAQLSKEKKDIDQKYTTIYNNSRLAGTAKTNLLAAKNAYNTSHNNLISAIDRAIADGKATEAEYNTVMNGFGDYEKKLATLTNRFEEANDYISSAKATNAESKAKAHADAEAQKAREAAEVYAKTKAEAERVIAEAYADGKVTAEEKARITDVNAKLKTAKDHADATSKSAEKAAKDYADTEIGKIEIGGRNLLIDSDFKESSNRFTYQRLDLERNGIELIATNDIVSTTSYPRILYKPLGNLEVGKQYTISFKAKSGGEPFSADFWVSTASGGNRQITPQKPHYTEQWKKYEYTITINENFSDETAIQWWVNATNPTTKQTLHLKEIQLEKGNKATDWTPAPEDIENKVDTINETVTKHNTSIKALENEISLKANSTTVTQQLNTALKPIKTDVQANKSELVLQKGLIEQRVSKTDYTTDMNGVVSRLKTSEGKISTLEKEIKLKVTETDVQNKIDELQIGGRNLLKNSDILYENTDYNIARYYFDEDIKEGEQVTVSLKGQLGSDRTAFTFYNSGGYVFLVSLYPSHQKNGIYTTTFDWKIKRNDTVASNGWLNVYQVANTGKTPSKIEWIKLERGNKMTDYSPAPEDTDERIKSAESEIKVNAGAISQKVSYTEINKTNKTLERVISELIVDVRGISYQYDVNGMISGFTLNKDYFKLNHNLIDINNGDVVIQNGKTTIKDAFINNLAGNTAFINSLTGKTAFINKIKAIDINAENIRVGFNKIAGSLQVTSTGLQMYNGKNKTMQLDDRGSTFWSGTRLIGRIGSSYLTNDSTVKTLRFALDDPNSMMSWEYKENSSDKNYQMMLQYSPKVQKGHDKRGFIFNDDVSMVPSRALQLSYLRPLNYIGNGNRIYLSTWTWRGTRGVSMVGGNENGSGVWFGNNVVALYANTSGKAGQGDLDIASDSRSYFIRSETIYERDYGYSANVFITKYGTLGRATSARKYKEFIELQHETEEKQLEHSKKILQLKPKTWYSKSLLETVAKEIETGEVDSVDDFKIERQFGMIADEFEEVGLTELVQYGKDDEVEGLAYDRISVHHNVLIKDLYDENDSLKDKINELENKLNMIMEKIK